MNLPADPATDAGPEEARARFWKLLGRQRVAMLSTHADGGRLRARPLRLQTDAEDDHSGRLTFFVVADSDVAREVEADPTVGVTFADSDADAYLSACGRAAIVVDTMRQKALWSAAAKPWFPEGPEDARLRLLDVQLECAEYWDTRESKMVQLFKLARAAATGRPPEDLGEHRSVPVR
ncbi:MAG: pyridoxamine 5'-phosphate oxidase family protein [Rubrivivax sp.]|nr:pyridoxamine 5'-phosphate oxidase family protein [Rubrivivax sp.]